MHVIVYEGCCVLATPDVKTFFEILKTEVEAKQVLKK